MFSYDYMFLDYLNARRMYETIIPKQVSQQERSMVQHGYLKSSRRSEMAIDTVQLTLTWQHPPP